VSAASQANRAVSVRCGLGSDVLLFASVSGVEALSSLFSYELEVFSEAGDIDPGALLGKPMLISYGHAEDAEHRLIQGYVTSFSQVGYHNRLNRFRATLRPWFWFLTRTADCRIFQEKTVPEIFEEVAKEYGFSDYRLELHHSYPKWEYCVQYRETDHSFLSRLLEQEGIYYYFEHFEDRHDLVLVDDPASHRSLTGYETVPFYPPGVHEKFRDRDHLVSWEVSQSVQTGAYALTDFDFEQPRKSLLGKSTLTAEHARSDFEIFDYPAELQATTSAESERIARMRIEQLHASRAVAFGSGNAAGLACGYRFELEGHPRTDLNTEYLITSAQVALSTDGYQSGAADAAPVFSLAIEAMDAARPFRPARVTPKPVVHGAQTAMVVGKSGEEIWTDEFGRIKVQFHWDRYGRRDENSSCWVRVAQAWAGDQWGAVQLPRIGQEVIVSFLEGDPDQPIVTGRVYNGTHKPPYALPDNRTQSGIKSRSTPGGTGENFNEIRFEDRKGEEQVYVHAERDLEAVVEHDQRITVGNDGHIDVTRNETIAIGKNRTGSIGEHDKLSVGRSYLLEAGEQITLRTGAAELIMKKDGTITLKGVKVTIDGQQTITAKAGQKLEAKALQISIKGTQTEIQGTLLDLKASAIATLKGALTKIG
jgi:type VI secretion system secreted protein VgrG